MKKQPPAHRFSLLLILALAVALASPAAGTSPPVLVVPDGAVTFDIDHATLEASLPPSTGPILQVTPAGRGSLTDRGTSHRYVPSAEFFDRGSDSFQFEYATSGGTAWQTVFLIAGMQTGWEFELTLEGPDPLAGAVLSDPQRITLNDVQPIDGAFDLLFELEPGVSPFLRPHKPGVAPGGGKIGGGIDPGGGRGTPAGSLVLAAAIDDTQPNRYVAELLLDADFGHMQIAAAVASDRSREVTPLVSAAKGQQWEVWWWAATAPGSRDGGAWLLVDGVIEATLSEIDNYGATASDWHFGALDNDGVSGFLQLDNLIGAAAVTLPRARPLFADNFEGDHRPWKFASCGGSGPIAQATAGALNLYPDPAVGSCFLGSETPEPVRHQRARFELSAGGLQLGGTGMAVYRASSPIGEDVLHLRLREQAGVLQLGGDTDLDDGTRVALPWIDLPPSGQAVVEVQWWAAAPGVDNGGLRLWVDGVFVGFVEGLANRDQRIVRIDLGAQGFGPGTAGNLAIDDFELWR